MDINDHAPQFKPPPSDPVYLISMDEGPSSLNKEVINFNATDEDYGKNAAIRYSLSGDEHGFFQLDAITVHLWNGNKYWRVFRLKVEWEKLGRL